MVKENTIKDEMAMKKLLSRMPKHVSDSFNEDQLLYLKIALGARNWGHHKVDIRGTFPIPFVSRRIYYVFLLGKNHRELSRGEKAMSAFTLSLFLSLFLLFCIASGLLILYLLKSALGVDLIPGVSFGVWSWFKGL